MKSAEDKFFLKARILAKERSTCLKIQTGAIIVKDGKIVGRGWNLCSPQGFQHGKKVHHCPRRELPSGVKYELCKPIHAEVLAVLDAGKKNCRGATMYLSGHYYPCWPCESFARFAGIKEIKVRSSGAKSFYKNKGLKLNRFTS